MQVGKNEPLECPACAWSTTWQAYHRTFKGQQLSAGGAGPFFRQYAESYPRARSYSKKVLLIDRLIHAFHCNAAGVATRAACVNLIEGRRSSVVRFLDELSAGETNPKLLRNRDEWRRRLPGRRHKGE